MNFKPTFARVQGNISSAKTFVSVRCWQIWATACTPIFDMTAPSWAPFSHSAPPRLLSTSTHTITSLWMWTLIESSRDWCWCCLSIASSAVDTARAQMSSASSRSPSTASECGSCVRSGAWDQRSCCLSTVSVSDLLSDLVLINTLWLHLC